MALPDKLYELRKKAGLSQEQLAERLGVSRQAVSKWETGRAVPESDTLVTISEFYRVTLDSLLKESGVSASGPESEPASAREPDRVSEPAAGADGRGQTGHAGREKRILGIAVSAVGAVSLLVWGIVALFMPSASDKIGGSSAVTVNGNGIVFALSLAAVVFGVAMLLKNSHR